MTGVVGGLSAPPPISGLQVAAYTIPTESVESDGTLEWSSTTIVVVRAHAGGVVGIRYSYTHHAAAELIRDVLENAVVGRDPLDVPAAWAEMRRRVRNIGRPGLVSTAISAVDTALWDLKARLLGVSLVGLLGRAFESIPLYGSGGFTSYSDDRLRRQLGGWAAEGSGW